MLPRALLFFLSHLSSIVWGLKCLSGHPTVPAVCQSLSYCVTIRNAKGSIQRACDGNGVNQLSLCAFNLAVRRPPGGGGVPSDYALYPSKSSNRYSPASTQQLCYNGGDLGEICCCQWEYCNGIPRNTPIALAFLIPIVFLFIGGYRL
ncbi:unnamed protein product, partial [Mesorhabditis spiculigera]